MKKYLLVLFIVFLAADCRNQIQMNTIDAKYYPCSFFGSRDNKEGVNLKFQVQKICKATIGDEGLSACIIPVTIYRSLKDATNKTRIYHKYLNNPACLWSNARLEVSFTCIDDTDGYAELGRFKSVVYNGGDMQIDCNSFSYTTPEPANYTPLHLTSFNVLEALVYGAVTGLTFAITEYAL